MHFFSKRLVRSTAETKDTRIGAHCAIGTNLIISDRIIIGKGSTIGANSVVSKSFPEKSVLVVAPGRSPISSN